MSAAVTVWVILLALVALFSWRLGALGTRSEERRHAAAVARRFGLPAGAVDQAFVRRVARRQRFVQTGVLLGLIVTTFVDAWLVPLYAGLALGAVADQLATPRLPPDTPRVAHATDARLRAYVPEWLLVAAAAAAACGPALAVLWAVAPTTEPRALHPEISTIETVALALASLGGLAVSLGLARFVVRRPQAAGSPADLAVDDAFRAQAVRDALHITAVVSLATCFVLGLKETEIGGSLRHVGGMLPVVLLLGIPAAGILHEFTAGPKHWRRRLGRETATG
ncbi:MAG TPA: hypothetical protein VI357_03970 [Mycobacteriales bacterium]